MSASGVGRIIGRFLPKKIPIGYDSPRNGRESTGSGLIFYNLELRMAVFTRRIPALNHLVARAGEIFSIGRFDSLDTGAAGVVKFEGVGVQDVVVLGGGWRRRRSRR